MTDQRIASESYEIVYDDIHLDPTYPRKTFLFNQLVIPGWITINDLKIRFYDNGLVRVTTSPYVSRPQYLRCIFSLLDTEKRVLVGQIFPRDFDFHHVDDAYLLDQQTEVRDDRCPPALQYSRWLSADITAIDP